MPECVECGDIATYWVEENYLSEDGVNGVERFEPVCRDCAEDAEPEGLREPVRDDYEFSITRMEEGLY